MKIICIDDSDSANRLVLGKCYDIIDAEDPPNMGADSNCYYIDYADGTWRWLKERFKKLEDIRQEKLEELGI